MLECRGFSITCMFAILNYRIRLTGSSANSIEIAALLLRNLAFSCQLLPALGRFPIRAVPFAQRRYKKRVMPFNGFYLIPQNGRNVDDELN